MRDSAPTDFWDGIGNWVERSPGKVGQGFRIIFAACGLVLAIFIIASLAFVFFFLAHQLPPGQV